MPSKSKAQHRLMQAAAHTPGGFGGVPQKVGRDFISADTATGKFKPKGKTMAKHGKHHSLSSHGSAVMGGDAGMSPRKAMGMGKGDGGGNFGVESYESVHGGPSEDHPDAKAMTGAKGPMADGERGIGMPIHHTKGHHPAQAAPDHGPTHPGGHMMAHGHHGHAVKA